MSAFSVVQAGLAAIPGAAGLTSRYRKEGRVLLRSFLLENKLPSSVSANYDYPLIGLIFYGSAMRIWWLAYAWVTHPNPKGAPSSSHRLQGRDWDALKEGGMRRENAAEMSATVPMMNTIWNNQSWMLPTKLKRGEESKFMRNDALSWAEWVSQNLPLAAWSHSTAGEEAGEHAICLDTHPMCYMLVTPHTSAAFYRWGGSPSQGW